MVDVTDYTTEGDKTALWTSFREMFSDCEMLKAEIDTLEKELQNNWANNEDFKKIIRGMELWIDNLQDDIIKIKRARENFRNRKIVKELSEDEGQTLTALFG